MTQFGLKIVALLLAIFQPFILLYFFGEQRSISQYWVTAGQPLFIITNAMTSYFLFSTNSWNLPALSLLLLTAFSVEFAPTAHNVFAGAFFVTCFIPIIKSRRYWWYIVPYILGGAVAVINLLYGEIIAVLSICAYHAHVMYHIYQLKK